MPRGHRRGDRKKGANVAVAAERAERTAIFGKTKMCKFFILGVCAKGRECCFAHDPNEMNPAPDLSRTKICKTLINTGFCDDPSCKYAHNKEELRAVPSEAPNAQGAPAPLEMQRQVSESSTGQQPGQPSQPGQPMPTQGQPPMGWKPGQQMPPELMQQLASNMAMQMTMLQMAMQANSNPSRPDPSSCPALPLAALTQQGAFVRQCSNQSESSADSRMQVAAQPSGMQLGHMSKLEHEDVAGRQGFRAGPVQAATVTLADVLGTGGPTASGPAADQRYAPAAAPAVHAPPPLWSKDDSLEDEFDAYTAPAVGGPMPQETSCPASEVFSGRQDMFTKEKKGLAQFPYHGDTSNLVVKNTFYDVPQSPITPAIHHSSTWAGSLNAIASQEKLPTEWEDAGLYEGSQDYQRQASDASTASSIGNLPPACEKRMQDTPIFAAGMGTPHPSEQELDTVYEGDLTPTGGDLADNGNDLDEHPAQRQMPRQFSDMPRQFSEGLDGVTVKNTFLEFAPEQPFVGMRAVRTAAGRLDSWGQD